MHRCGDDGSVTKATVDGTFGVHVVQVLGQGHHVHEGRDRRVQQEGLVVANQRVSDRPLPLPARVHQVSTFSSRSAHWSTKTVGG